MSLIVLPLALLAALAGGWLVWQRWGAKASAPAARLPRTPVPPAEPGRRGGGGQPAPATPVPAPDTPSPPPAALATARWSTPEALPADQRQALVAAVGRIPRPPGALNQMLSPDFLERATSQALADLITAEPQIAAQVLATVNSPLYGLKQPVAGIGQAVTFLGLNTVRSLCLRQLLDGAFPADQPTLREAYAQVWRASAVASELCNRLAPKLRLADPGALATQVLLSFVGHLAATMLLARQPGAGPALPAAAGLLARHQATEAALGLGPAELGGLLLRGWGLPAEIVDPVRAIDRLLITPAGGVPATAARRLAVAHLCARLGEQLATGAGLAPGGPVGLAPGMLAGLAAGVAGADDGFHLRAHLADPALARLAAHLNGQDVMQVLHPLLQHPRPRG